MKPNPLSVFFLIVPVIVAIAILQIPVERGSITQAGTGCSRGSRTLTASGRLPPYSARFHDIRHDGTCRRRGGRNRCAAIPWGCEVVGSDPELVDVLDDRKPTKASRLPVSLRERPFFRAARVLAD